MKKVESLLCSMCDTEAETLAHMTIHCKYPKKKLSKDIKERCGSQLSLPDLTEEIVYSGWLSKVVVQILSVYCEEGCKQSMPFGI